MSNSILAIYGLASVDDNLTRYFTIIGRLEHNALEVDIELPIRDAGIFSNLYSYVSANTVNPTSILTLRKSRVNTSVTVSYTTDQTGIKEDTVNTATFAATDEISWQLVVPSQGGTNTITFTA